MGYFSFYGIDLISFAIGVLISALFSLWLNFYIKQPVLFNSGGGSGSCNDGTQQNSLTFYNKVGWFGINIQESRLFGMKIHPRIKYGLNFEKVPARDCRANLILKETKEHVGALWWMLEDGSFTDIVTINSGSQASLKLFCKSQNDAAFFVFRPTSKTNGQAILPDEKNKFEGSQKFILRIDYSHGRIFEQEISITRKYNGLLYLEYQNGSSYFG